MKPWEIGDLEPRPSPRLLGLKGRRNSAQGETLGNRAPRITATCGTNLSTGFLRPFRPPHLLGVRGGLLLVPGLNPGLDSYGPSGHASPERFRDRKPTGSGGRNSRESAKRPSSQGWSDSAIPSLRRASSDDRLAPLRYSARARSMTAWNLRLSVIDSTSASSMGKSACNGMAPIGQDERFLSKLAGILFGGVCRLSDFYLLHSSCSIPPIRTGSLAFRPKAQMVAVLGSTL